MKKFFTLIAVAAMAFAAQANVLTLCEGTDYSQKVPVFGYMYDVELTTSQMIYPAEMLTDMVGATITQVKFYSEEINFYGGELALGMKCNAKDNFDDETLVLTSACAVITPVEGAQELVFDLDEPFVYEGGNLLLDVCVYESGQWGTTEFCGVNVNYYASISSYEDKYHNVVYEPIDFLPKVTFTYEAAATGETCAKPEGSFENGIDFHGVTVTLINNETAEGTELHYNITLNGELIIEDAIYEDAFALTVDGEYYIDFWATAPGMQDSSHGGLIFTIDPITGLSEVAGGKTVAGVRYYNMAGQEMQQADGMTIVVTTYTDGTTSAVKVVK
jgi:hypothetical protein